MKFVDVVYAMVRIGALLGLAAAAASGCARSDAEKTQTSARVSGDPIAMGRWRAVLTVPGGEIPFVFELAGAPDTLSAEIVNGDERIPVGEVAIDGATLTLHLPGFNSTIAATLESGVLVGSLTLVKRGGVEQAIPLRAEYAQGYTFTQPGEEPAVDVSGRWDVTFVDDEGASYQAIGEFRQDGTELRGTFLTTTGDYRFLSGEVAGRDVTLSCFDGAHAYLFKATLRADGTLAGDYWSGTKWHETWTGVADADATLPDPDSLTTLAEGYRTLDFTFPDPDGRTVSLSDAQFRGKVVVVTIGGTWCPNCHDEAAFLARLYNERRDRGLEIVGLMYEHYRESDRAARQVARFRDNDRIPYPLLVAGYSDRAEANKTLPMLSGGLKAFPTMIVMDRSGTVRRIHTGFSGPGTGEHYTSFAGEFTAFIDALLAE